MNSQNRKVLSWSVSILVHSVILFIIVRASLHYVFPEGEVTTNAANFEVVEGPKGRQSVVPAKKSVEEAPDKMTPTLPAEKKAPKMAAAPKEPEPKFVPYKENNGIKAAEPDRDEEEESPPAVLPPKTEKTAANKTQDEENVAEQLPAKETEPIAKPTQAPEATEAPAPQPEAQENSQPVAETAAPEKQAEAGQDQAPSPGEKTATPPQYGSPGSTLDETTLTELPGNGKPSYPWLARLRRQEGTVVLRAYIRKDGHVDLPILEKSSGSTLLDQECIKSYAKWRYQPGPSGWVIKPFKFSLTK